MRLAAFDALSPKSVALATQRTSWGGLLSLVVLLTMTVLLVHEVRGLFQVTLLEHVVLDPSSPGAKVDIHVDISFPALPCSGVALAMSDAKGEQRTDISSGFNKQPLPARSGGENGSSASQGCRLSGVLEVDQVAGELHVALATPSAQARAVRIDVNEMVHYNTSHVIHLLSFGEPLEGVPRALDGVSRVVHKDSAQFTYKLGVVPTTYRPLGGQESTTSQYSVSESMVEVHAPTLADMFSGVKIPGVYVRYTFSPIIIVKEETRTTLAHFATRLCAVLGGVYAAASLFDSIMHETVLRKKLD